jgi:hypothetical protein
MPALFANSAGIVHYVTILRQAEVARPVLPRALMRGFDLPPGARSFSFLKPAAIL